MVKLAFSTLVACVIALVCASTSQARFWHVDCNPNQNRQVDPIVSPGVSPSAHMHTFFAATNVTQFSTTASLEAGGTSCTSGAFQPDSGGQVPMTAAEVRANTAGIWMPQMKVNGVGRNPQYLVDYWSDTGIGGRSFVDIPEGAKIVAGDSHATGPQPMYKLFWNCGTDFVDTYPNSTKPPQCPQAHPLMAHMMLPPCWNGTGLNPSDFTYPTAPVPFRIEPQYNACPAAFPKQLPHTQEIIHTGLYVGGGLNKMTFSSGPYYTLHVDYWQAWSNQSTYQSLENFLRTNKIP